MSLVVAFQLLLARNVLHLDLNAIPTVANPPGLANDGDLEAMA